MARTLRYKLASMALCAVVVATNGLPAMAQGAANQNVEMQGAGIVKSETTTSSALEIESETTTSSALTVADGEYLVDINVLKAGSDDASHAASFLVTEDVPLTVKEGKGYLTIKVTKDPMNIPNALATVEQRIGDTYTELELKYMDDENMRYVEAEVVFEALDEAAYVQCGINGMPHKSPFRVVLDIENSSEAVAVEEINTTENSIEILATGGSNVYEYTIDGGAEWSDNNLFTNLEAGTYQVAVRDKNNTSNKSAVQEVILKSSGVVDGEYFVNIKVLKTNSDDASHAASFLATEEVPLTVKDGKGYLTLTVTKDPMGMAGALATVEQLTGDTYKELALKYMDDESIRYVEAEAVFETLDEIIYVQCGINGMPHKSPFRIVLDLENRVEAVNIEVTTTSNSIDVNATGGSGDYEYSIEGGKNWVATPRFENLSAGSYTVVARDKNQTSNVSSEKVVTLAGQTQDPSDLEDGYYSVDIRVLQESSNTASMAEQFFNQENLPLRISNGKAYLTIQVLKDGMSMTDVISSLEQRINGSFQDLSLDYLDDSSKRYVTAEIEFDSISEDVYLRCGIAPMAPMKPVLRVQLIEESISMGAGSIDPGIAATMISSVTAENGQVKITLNQEDSTITKEAFSAALYKEGEAKGEALKLEDFKVQGNEVTFSFEQIEAMEQKQNYVVGITFEETETKSNSFTVDGLLPEVSGDRSILKENVLEIKYINGFEDGTFKANQATSKAEALHMLAALVEAPEVSVDYQLATIDVLQADKDEASIAKQFFKTEDVKVVADGDGYMVEFEINNEGMGFKDIISSFEVKVGSTYQALKVTKSADLKTAYIRVPVEKLSDALVLRAGIVPMGDVKPDLRVVFKEVKEGEFVSQYTDIDMWAKESIMLFEKLGIIGEDGAMQFGPRENMTRGEFVKVIARVMKLDLSETSETIYTDVSGHAYEDYINACSQAGYVVGFEDGTFRPENTITRAEIVSMINRVIGHDASTHVTISNPFKDLKETHWAYKEIIKITNVK